MAPTEPLTIERNVVEIKSQPIVYRAGATPPMFVHLPTSSNSKVSITFEHSNSIRTKTEKSIHNTNLYDDIDEADFYRIPTSIPTLLFSIV